MFVYISFVTLTANIISKVVYQRLYECTLSNQFLKVIKQ